MHKTVTSERTAAARMRNALGGLRQQGAPPVSDWAAPKDRERWTYEVQENLRTAAPVSQTNAMDGKVATMEDIARLLNETLDELDAQYAILGGGALNDDSSMLSSALDDSALGVAFGGSTLNSAHDRSTPGFALDGSSPSPTLNGPGGSMLGSAPVGSALEGLMLNSALDGLGSSALGVAFGSSTLSSAHDRSTLGCALDVVGSSALARSSVLVELGGPALDGLGGSMLGSALDGLHGSAGARRCIWRLDAQLGARQIDA